MPLRLVIFDCDGVLVDSETAANRVVAEVLTGLGWTITGEECRARFMGMTLSDMRPLIEARVGRQPADFTRRLAARLVERLGQEVEAMPGAIEALQATTALGLPWRVASNSSRAEMAVKFARTGLAPLVAGRVHSAEDVVARGGRGKPAPDVFLAAAAAEGVDPAACLVIEDSVPGTQGAIAAGMECLGFAPHGGGEELRREGAELIRGFAELPGMLRARMRRAA
jgi:HAD superfamily hydrolase (TIGR01509 family)